MIPFFKKNLFEDELEGLKDFYTKHFDIRSVVKDYISNNYKYNRFYLTKSCTQSLELAFMTLNLPIGSEVILPSYGFVSLANAILLNGLKCVFVDCEPETMNIDVNAAINAISPKTRAIVTINYGGVSCDYDKLIPICRENGIIVIEDNAHGINAQYKGQYLGKQGDISTISFDYLKCISCNEGGGIQINELEFYSDFLKSYYFGTNRQDFINGDASFYEWHKKGTNSLIAEHLAVILISQLRKSSEIKEAYISKWESYYNELQILEEKEFIETAKIPEYAQHNGHIFWIKCKDATERNNLIQFLKLNLIETAFHYTPLHNSKAGKEFGEFRGADRFTTNDSNRLLRLPLYYQLKKSEQSYIIENIYNFYKNI